MRDISIVIVSYNNADLLMLTLASVRRATEGLDAETFVVDNCSADDTADRVTTESPWVRLISLPSNIGFSRANNEAMRLCDGRVVVILNPDTIVCRDTFRRLHAHFEANPHSGAVGVRMVNGEGRFLRESKRGYTDLRTSFFKLTGLWHLAPKSGLFNAYYIGQHGEKEICAAPILSGACMAFSHKLMDKTGYFDDDYFMYSEDIDLSWRMDRNSEGNTYRGDISIVHFKGQSTPRKKKYICYFYKSMLLFAKKHEYHKHNALVNLFTLLGIKSAYALSLIYCLMRRCVERHKLFTMPKSPILITDNVELSGRASIESATFSNILSAAKADTVVFDIDGSMNAAIEYMRSHSGKQRFGFYNPDNGQTLIYYNNRCHTLSITTEKQ